MSDAPWSPPRYPPGTVRALLSSAHVGAATRAALESRLAANAPALPRYFGADEYRTLRAACERLVPQPDRDTPIDLAATIDQRLAEGTGDGWRYDAMPPDGDAHRAGLRALDAGARDASGHAFADANVDVQDAVLRAAQRGAESRAAWGAVPPGRFFEELLAEAAEAYYSHPLAQEEIGFVGMADLPGWQAIGLDELEPREPRPQRASDG